MTKEICCEVLMGVAVSVGRVASIMFIVLVVSVVGH